MRRKSIKPKTHYVDSDYQRNRVFVRERGSGIPVACFRYWDEGNQSTIALLTAVIHSLTLDDPTRRKRHVTK